jgi:hypothetical protein
MNDITFSLASISSSSPTPNDERRATTTRPGIHEPKKQQKTNPKKQNDDEYLGRSLARYVICFLNLTDLLG